jgi:hypothetical protein
MQSTFACRRRGAIAVVALTLLVACGSDATTSTPTETVTLSISAPSTSLLVGETTVLRAVVSRSTGNPTVSWSSSNAAIVLVDTSGAATAVAPGVATIRAVVAGQSSSVDIAVAASAAMLAVSASYFDVCGVTTSGALYCAGRTYGNAPKAVAPALRFKNIRGFGAPETSSGFCAIASDDSAYCWGSNDFGQLGVGDTQYRDVPTPVVGGLHFKTIAPGDDITCGVTLDGKGYCWGAGSTGAIGDSQSLDRSIPTPVQLDLPLKDISTGNYAGGGKNGPNAYTCALTAGGQLYCWGGNTTGQLGDNNVPVSTIAPHAAATTVTFASLNQGNTLFACALTPDGTPYCWGNGDALQASTFCPFPGGVVHACLPIPTQIATPLRFTMLTAGSGGGVCGITMNHEVACWGVSANQRFGEAGSAACPNGCGSNPVATMTGFTTVSMSVYTACGIATNQRAYCWGDNASQQIGALAPAMTGVATLFRVPASASP